MKRAAAFVLVAVLASPALALAAPNDKSKDARDECNAGAEASQLFRDSGKLIDARKQALLCVAASCPKVIQSDCVQWLADLDKRIPSIAVSAMDAAGNDVNNVSVEIDGSSVATALDGRALLLDPGPHHITFMRPGSPNVERNVTLSEGERTRPIRVQFEAAHPAAPALAPVQAPPRSSTSVVVPVVLGAVGVAGLATFFVYHFSAKNDLDQLRSACAPGCSHDAADTVDRKIMVSHIALGVGITAIVGAALTFFYPRSKGDGSQQKAASPRAWNTF